MHRTVEPWGPPTSAPSTRGAWVTGGKLARDVLFTSHGPGGYDTTRGFSATQRSSPRGCSFGSTARQTATSADMGDLHRRNVKDRLADVHARPRPAPQGHLSHIPGRTPHGESSPIKTNEGDVVVVEYGTPGSPASPEDSAATAQEEAQWRMPAVPRLPLATLPSDQQRHQQIQTVDFVERNRAASSRRPEATPHPPSAPSSVDARIRRARRRRQLQAAEETKRREWLAGREQRHVRQKRQHLWVRTIAVLRRMDLLTRAMYQRRRDVLDKVIHRMMHRRKQRVFQEWVRFVRHRKLMWATNTLYMKLPGMIRRHLRDRKDRNADKIRHFLQYLHQMNDGIRACRLFYARALRVQRFLRDVRATLLAQLALCCLQWDRALLQVRVRGLKHRMKRERRRSVVSRTLSAIGRKHVRAASSRSVAAMVEPWLQARLADEGIGRGRLGSHGDASDDGASGHESCTGLDSPSGLPDNQHAFKHPDDEEMEWEEILTHIVRMPESAAEQSVLEARRELETSQLASRRHPPSPRNGDTHDASSTAAMTATTTSTTKTRARRLSVSQQSVGLDPEMLSPWSASRVGFKSGRSLASMQRTLQVVRAQLGMPAGGTVFDLDLLERGASHRLTGVQRTDLAAAGLHMQTLQEFPNVDPDIRDRHIRDMLQIRRRAFCKTAKRYRLRMQQWRREFQDEWNHAMHRLRTLRGNVSDEEKSALREYMLARQPQAPFFSPLPAIEDMMEVVERAVQEQHRRAGTQFRRSASHTRVAPVNDNSD